jgi:hypothetical protein
MDTLEILMKLYPGWVLLTVDETANACGLAPSSKSFLPMCLLRCAA